MTRLVFRGLLFFLGGWLLIYSLAWLAEKTSPDSTATFLLIDEMHVNNVLANRSDVEALVLGSSHGDDIDFPTLNYRGFTLARAWGDLFETEYYLKFLVPKLPSLKAVFIPVSYFTFSWDNASVEKLNVRRSQMYTVIPTWGFIPGDIKNFLVGRGNKLFPIQGVLREDNWSSVVYAMIHRESNSGVYQELVENCDYKSEIELDKISSGRVDDTVRSMQEIAARRPGIQDDTYRKAQDIIRFLQQRGIRVVFFTPPYYSKYTDYFMQNDTDSIAVMEANMERLKDTFGVEYYDHSRDRAFVNDYRNFKDSDHLNLCGKQSFSGVLEQEMSLAK